MLDPIACADMEAGQLRVSATASRDLHRLLSKNFDKLRQIASTRMHSQGGLGVGLALTRQLMELHHGISTFQSEGPGLESTFTIRLPLLDIISPASLRTL